jgi:hypothetical protein
MVDTNKADISKVAINNKHTRVTPLSSRHQSTLHGQLNSSSTRRRMAVRPVPVRRILMLRE